MPRKSNLTTIINPSIKKYQDIYAQGQLTPDDFANVVIQQFVDNNTNLTEIPNEIDFIDRAFKRELSLPIIKSLLNNYCIIDSQLGKVPQI